MDERNIILKVLAGSKAYGLDTPSSDTDIRGVYVAENYELLSLNPPPEQINGEGEDEVYWEVGKFVNLALKANPNILEVLYTPKDKVIHMGKWGDSLVLHRDSFLSKLVTKTYGGYAISQLEKFERSVKLNDTPDWKNAMHLLRLLYCGIMLLRNGELMVDMGRQKGFLLAVKRGEVSVEDIKKIYTTWERAFNGAAKLTKLPDEPNYEDVNELLLRIRGYHPSDSGSYSHYNHDYRSPSAGPF